MNPPNLGNDIWFHCFYSILVRYDLDHSVWPLIPNYYFREGKYNVREIFSPANPSMTGPISENMQRKMKLLASNRTQIARKVVHVRSALCLVHDGEDVKLGPCDTASAWNRSGSGAFSVGPDHCLVASMDQGIKIGSCRENSLNLHEAGKLKLVDGRNRCLTSSDDTRVTIEECRDDLDSWFMIIQ